MMQVFYSKSNEATMTTLALILVFCISVYCIAMFSMEMDINDYKSLIQIIILAFFLGCVTSFAMFNTLDVKDTIIEYQKSDVQMQHP